MCVCAFDVCSVVGCRVYGLGLVEVVGFKVLGLGFRVEGLGFENLHFSCRTHKQYINNTIGTLWKHMLSFVHCSCRSAQFAPVQCVANVLLMCCCCVANVLLLCC